MDTFLLLRAWKRRQIDFFSFVKMGLWSCFIQEVFTILKQLARNKPPLGSVSYIGETKRPLHKRPSSFTYSLCSSFIYLYDLFSTLAGKSCKEVMNIESQKVVLKISFNKAIINEVRNLLHLGFLYHFLSWKARSSQNTLCIFILPVKVVEMLMSVFIIENRENIYIKNIFLSAKIFRHDMSIVMLANWTELEQKYREM